MAGSRRATNVYTYTLDAKPGLACWTPDGKLLLGVSRVMRDLAECAEPAHGRPPGKLYGLTNAAGRRRRLHRHRPDYFGPYHLFTRDGIYVAMLMRDGRDGKGLGPDVTASEVFTGQLVKPDGMNRYFLLAGAADARVTEIFGLDTVKRAARRHAHHHARQTRNRPPMRWPITTRSWRAARRLSIARGRTALDTADPVNESAGCRAQFHRARGL